jgi:uncharacterized membrane protein YphA (DoxX/SURF4 family)
MGQAFFLTGRGSSPTSQHGGVLHRPRHPDARLNAAVVSRLEFTGGILLVLGLGTRLVAAGLASTMVVALLTADKRPSWMP